MTSYFSRLLGSVSAASRIESLASPAVAPSPGDDIVETQEIVTLTGSGVREASRPPSSPPLSPEPAGLSAPAGQLGAQVAPPAPAPVPRAAAVAPGEAVWPVPVPSQGEDEPAPPQAPAGAPAFPEVRAGLPVQSARVVPPPSVLPRTPWAPMAGETEAIPEPPPVRMETSAPPPQPQAPAESRALLARALRWVGTPDVPPPAVPVPPTRQTDRRPPDTAREGPEPRETRVDTPGPRQAATRPAAPAPGRVEPTAQSTDATSPVEEDLVRISIGEVHVRLDPPPASRPAPARPARPAPAASLTPTGARRRCLHL